MPKWKCHGQVRVSFSPGWSYLLCWGPFKRNLKDCRSGERIIIKKVLNVIIKLYRLNHLSWELLKMSLLFDQLHGWRLMMTQIRGNVGISQINAYKNSEHPSRGETHSLPDGQAWSAAYRLNMGIKSKRKGKAKNLIACVPCGHFHI